MKKHFILLILAATLVLPSCSKYGYVNLDYPLDPMVVLPNGIHTIAVVNRSLVKEDDKSSTILESIATAEIAGSDKLASDECLKGAFDKVNGQDIVSIVIPQQTRLYGSGSAQTPELLDWTRMSLTSGRSRGTVQAGTSPSRRSNAPESGVTASPSPPSSSDGSGSPVASSR